MITNSVFVGIIGAFAIIGASSFLELLLLLLIHIIGRWCKKTAFRVDLGAESGFELQSATSIYCAWLKITKCARERYEMGSAHEKQWPGIAIISFVSVLSIGVLILIEVAVVYVSQSTTTYKKIEEGGLKMITVGVGGRLSEENVHNDYVEINRTEFLSHGSSSYIVQAQMVYFSSTNVFFKNLAKASAHMDKNITIWTEYMTDGRNKDEPTISAGRNNRNTSNYFAIYSDRHPNQRIMFRLRRELQTFTTSRTEVFTDFGEAEARLMQRLIFISLFMSCTMLNQVVQEAQLNMYTCQMHKHFKTSHEVAWATFPGIQKLNKLLFQISDFTVEWEVSRDNVQEKGALLRGVFGTVTGVDTSQTKYKLVFAAALVGLLRILISAIFDYRRLAETVMFKASFNGNGWAGPGNWDGKDDCKWRVYKTQNGNRFGYTTESWSDNFTSFCY